MPGRRGRSQGAKNTEQVEEKEPLEGSSKAAATELEGKKDEPKTNGDTKPKADTAVNGKDESKKGDAQKLDDKKDDANNDGEKKEDSKKDGDKTKEQDDKQPAKKPIKKTIPVWATVVQKSAPGSPVKQKLEVGSGGMAGVIISVMEDMSAGGGSVSNLKLTNEVKKRCPTWKKWMVKKGIAKAMDKGRLKQVKGSFKLLAAKPAPAARSKKEASKHPKSEKLDDLLGNIFTWVCEPKECSILLIKKYIDTHHSKLSNDNRLKKAIEMGIEKGQLERINGKGFSGTVALVDKAKKTGTTYEDAIEDAIIACNEPKDASIPALKHYLSEYHTEFNVATRPHVLFNCLERCEAKGWITRISGKGKGGSFRLAVPYRPGPKELWGEWYEPDEPPKKRAKKAAAEESSDDEDESSEEEEEDSSEDDEPVYVPRPSKTRAPPSARATAAAKRSKAPATSKKSAPKKKAPKPAKGRPPAVVTAKKSKPPPPPPTPKASKKGRGRPKK